MRFSLNPKSTNIYIAFTFLLAFAVCVSAQNNSQRSEIEGYEFFGKGLLESLNLGISTKEDIQKVFGEVCDSECNFDEKWTIKFEYFPMLAQLRKENGLWEHYLPNPEYKDKLYSIKLFPKSRIPFEELKITCKFLISDCSRTDNPPRISEPLPYKLHYVIWYRDNDRGCLARFSECKRRDLSYILYEVTADVEEKMFVKEN